MKPAPPHRTRAPGVAPRTAATIGIAFVCAGLVLPALSAMPAASPALAAAARAGSRPLIASPDLVRRRMIAVMLDETNRERASSRRRALALSEELSAAAQAHAEDMLARSYFAHESPEGETSAGRVARLAPRAIVLSVRENILRTEGQEDDADHVRAAMTIDGWMGSPGHRRNLLADDVTEVGFGVASRLDRGRLSEYSVQVLGRVVGAWTRVPPTPLRVPGGLRARLTVPVEFFLEDTAHPDRHYKDPADASYAWIGGVPLVVVPDTGGSVVQLPKLDPGRYRLLGRLERKEGYQALREIRVAL